MTLVDAEMGFGCKWPLQTRQSLEAMSASRRDGISAELEWAYKWAAIKVIIYAAQKLKMDHFALASACVFLHRYFARKSLAPHRNNVLLVAVACLYLAGKAEDSPKSVRDVLYACMERRYKDCPEVLRQFHQRDWYEKARERIFLAERALLYEMGFAFNVDHPYTTIVVLLADGPVSEELLAVHRALLHYKQQTKLLAHLSFQLANESLKTTLCLQYSGQKIAVACVWLATKLLQLQPPPDDASMAWWALVGLQPQELDDIQEQLLGLYMSPVKEAVAGTDAALASVSLASHDELEARALETQAQAAAEERRQAEEQQRQQQGRETEQQGNGVTHGPGRAAAAWASANRAPPPSAAPAGLDELDELESFLGA